MQYLKNALIGQAAEKAMMATKAANAALYAGAVGAQVTVTTALAAQSAFAATAAIPLVGPVLAPAAAVVTAVALGRPIVIVGTLHLASPTTITVPLVDSMSQLFSTTSQVTIDNKLPVRPEWFGLSVGCIQRAVNALPSTGGEVVLENRRYPRQNFAYSATAGVPGTCLAKKNVKLRGAKMPQFNSTMSALEGGTIIDGFFLAYADYFEHCDLGYDAGRDVVNAQYGGSAVDAFVFTYPDIDSKNAATLRRGVKHHNVIGLCKDPLAPVHALILAEGATSVACTGEVIAGYGIHGIVLKANGITAEKFAAYCNGGEGVMIKSDLQATARAGRIMIGQLMASAAGPNGTTPHTAASTGYGLLFQTSGGNIDQVSIDSANISGFPTQIGAQFASNHTISSIDITKAILDGTGVAGTTKGLEVLGAANQVVSRFHVGSIDVRNVTVGVQAIFKQVSGTQSNHLSIDRLEHAFGDTALDIGDQAYVDIGVVVTNTLTGGVYHITGTPKLLVGRLFKDTATPNTYNPANGGLVPTLANGWTQVAANDPFAVDLAGGVIRLRGLVKPGSSNILCTLPQWAWPASTKRFVAQGYNGTTQVAVPVGVGTNGQVSVNEVAGGVANVTSWLSLSGISWDSQA